jgi:hypothetical protein
MAKVTITKEEYKKLQQQSKAYQKLATRLFESIIKDPIREVVQDFRDTGLYSKEFLADLEVGLRKSSYAKSK